MGCGESAIWRASYGSMGSRSRRRVLMVSSVMLHVTSVEGRSGSAQPNPYPLPEREGEPDAERGRAFPLPVLRGTKSRILSYYWVQGSPLPKEVCGTHGGFRI